MEFWAQRTVSALDGRVGWTVVDETYRELREARSYLRWLRFGSGAAEGTARQYAHRLALYFTFLAETGRDWTTVSSDDFTAFVLWLQHTPSRSTRGDRRRTGSHQRRAFGESERSNKTINSVITVVREFYRYHARHDTVSSTMTALLGESRPQRFLPMNVLPEGASTAAVDTKLFHLKTSTSAPKTLTASQIAAVLDSCLHQRDRLLVLLCWRAGLRLSESLGLHREDLHFLPSAEHLGCDVPGAHVHVIRRPENENGAFAKSPHSRHVPVGREVVSAYTAYRWERDAVALAGDSDFVFVNLWRQPIGRAMSPGAGQELFERLSRQVGFRVRPHMLRHTFGSTLADNGVELDVIQMLMGHRSITSTEVYLHPHWARMVVAVDQIRATPKEHSA